MAAAGPQELLAELGATLPVLAAPMAGGAGTPALAIAAARAGSFGFLAGGYKSAGALEAELAELGTAAVPYGVNLFAPCPVPVDPEAYRAYAAELRPEAERVGAALPEGPPREDDDGWREKLEVLVASPPPLVSFTFGMPPPADAAALRAAGAMLAQTVTSPAEAEAASSAGFDALIVQSAAAGGHWGTFTPAQPPPPLGLAELLAAIRQRTRLPLLAAGGVASPAQASEALSAGAAAVLVGTALLLADEAGTAATHRAALHDPGRSRTAVTRAFTGRPARGLVNGFMERHEASAPLGYPAIHHLTSPLRRAAAAAGEAELLHLWAGAGFAACREAPAGEILLALCAG